MMDRKDMSILLAHRNPIVLSNLADELRRRRVRAKVYMARNEAHLVQTQWFSPSRVVLLDLAFAQSERFLKCLSADPINPSIYVCSDSEDDAALPEAVRQGACRYAAGKTPVGVICDQLEKMLAAWNGGDPSPAPCRRRESARELLLLAGVSPRTKGGRYIRLALDMAVADSSLLYNLNGRLFPAMALQAGDTPENIERCMRYAVHQIWRHMEPDDRLRFLSCDGRPTVRQFLSAFVERLEKQEEMGRELFL